MDAKWECEKCGQRYSRYNEHRCSGPNVLAEYRASLVRNVPSAHELVQQQAEDEGLWFVAKYSTEAYLQQELRKLHAAVEADFKGSLNV